MSVIWITGGKGFIGRHLARHASAEGIKTFGIGHGHWSTGESSKWQYAHWSNADIDGASLTQLANISGLPETVFHLAGGSSVGASFENPLEDFHRTVVTTARLLEWVRLNSVKTRVVATSSAAVYGEGHAGAIRESTPLRPFSPYGNHKAMMEVLFRSFAHSFNVRSAIVRLFSVYGPGLEKQLIWDLCSKLSARGVSSVRLGGTGEEVRDWLHVEDAAKLLWLCRSACSTKVPCVNGGNGTGNRIAEIASLVTTAWRTDVPVVFSGKSRAGDPVSLLADISNARVMGFSPAISVADGIRETVAWFKQVRALP